MAKKPEVTLEELYALKINTGWRAFWSEHFSFWMICGYLFIEYVRPQSIIPALDFLPWAQLFLLLALIGVFFDRPAKWVSDPANKWMVGFFIVILLSSWNAYWPSISFEYLNSFYTWLVIYFLIINIIKTPKRLFIFGAIWVVASFKISFSLALVWAKRGFGFTTWGLMGPPGYFANSGELAIQMAVFFPVAYLIAVQLRPHVSRALFVILALMPITAAMTVLGASSRGGQLALIVQMLLLFYRYVFRPKIFIGLLLVAAAIFFLLPAEQKQRFESVGEDRTSMQRLNYWEGGIDMLNKHPMLGVGYFNFAPYFERNYRDKMLYPEVQLPHNILVQVGADLGYAGLLIYLALINRGFLRKRDAHGLVPARWDLSLSFRCMNVSFIGFLVAGQFVSVVYYPFMWIHLALVVSVKNIIRNASTGTSKKLVHAKATMQ